MIMRGIPVGRFCYLITTYLVLATIIVLLLDLEAKFKILEAMKYLNSSDIKFILQWSTNGTPFNQYKEEGISAFVEFNCEYKNCFVTTQKNLLVDYINFDVIVFHEVQFGERGVIIPLRRSAHQKYVFASTQPQGYNPVCSNKYEGFFNWTWTFKLDSDLECGNITIRDSNNTIIGPKKEMHWMKLADMDPVPLYLRHNLRKKRKLALWFESNCASKSKIEVFVKSLNIELGQSWHRVDIFRQCGLNKIRSRDEERKYKQMIRKDYLFYLALEKSVDEDYVTENLLRALKYNAVPVVYGGANYTRFMPDGIYLNAKTLGVKQLAAKMLELTKDFEKYVEYFRWTNHYTYHHRNVKSDSNNYCKICALLNNRSKVEEVTVHEKFREWWNGENKCIKS